MPEITNLETVIEYDSKLKQKLEERETYHIQQALLDGKQLLNKKKITLTSNE